VSRGAVTKNVAEHPEPQKGNMGNGTAEIEHIKNKTKTPHAAVLPTRVGKNFGFG